MNSKLKIKTDVEIITVIFSICLPLLSAHTILGGRTLGDVALFIIVIYILINSKGRIKVVKFTPFFLFFIIVVLQTIFQTMQPQKYTSLSAVGNRFLMTLLMFLSTIMIIYKINTEFFYRIYNIIGIICMVLILVQAIQVYILNVDMTILVPFAEYAMKEQELLYSIQRPSAVFLEPQHYASFMLPLLIYKMQMKKIVFSIIISITILMANSSQGIIICGCTWILYLLFSKDITVRKKMLLTILIASLMVLISTMPFWMNALDKIQSISIENNIRIARAWGVYSEMPLKDKLIGIGLNNVNKYIEISGNAWQWHMADASPAKNFLSSLGGNFVSFGFAGGIAFILMLWFMFSKACGMNKIWVIVIGLSSLSQTLVFNVWFFFYWVVYFINLKECNKREGKYDVRDEESRNTYISLCR